ncbi:MAG TPA: biotin/lipoyl-binding protein [Planctomycetota bacterium]|jgi:biotin carboxyl carrier protein|nr:biotin/lipoyl-binding protein [Planctomycetota bacterium]
MKYLVSCDGLQQEISVVPRDDGRYTVTLKDGRRVVADLRSVGGDSLYSMLLGDESFEVSVVPVEELARVTVRGRDMLLRVESEQERNARLVEGEGKASGPQTIRSVMPGRVVRVLVNEGETVGAGTSILILEAMKMENEIRSPVAGVLKKLFVKDGQTVGNGEPLATVDASPASSC